MNVRATVDTNAAPSAGRGRLPYTLTPVLERLADNARQDDADLKSITAEFITALQDDGIIDASEAARILPKLISLFQHNSGDLTVLSLLTNGYIEPALLETERLEQVANEQKKGRKAR